MLFIALSAIFALTARAAPFSAAFSQASQAILGQEEITAKGAYRYAGSDRRGQACSVTVRFEPALIEVGLQVAGHPELVASLPDLAQDAPDTEVNSNTQWISWKLPATDGASTLFRAEFRDELTGPSRLQFVALSRVSPDEQTTQGDCGHLEPASCPP